VALLNFSLATFEYSAAWTTPVVLALVGVIVAKQAHNDEFAGFMGYAFAICAISSAVLRALMNLDPTRWGAFTAYTLSLTAFSLAGQSKAIGMALMKNYMAHTVFLGICVLAALMLVPLLVFVYWTTRFDISVRSSLHAKSGDYYTRVALHGKTEDGNEHSKGV
jgi:hypothetical protein